MLRCHDLTLRYGSVTALAGLSLDVRRGEMTGFVGPNGAGKTSTMRIILGVLGADSGELTWEGAPLDAATRRQFGYMPEERGLYPKMGIADQLTYLARLHGLARPAARAATDELLDRLTLTERADDPLEALSLGNQQRVQLAAALIHRPKLLVLDEPFSGLDPIGVDVLAGVLREEVDRGVPVLFSSHQLELVERLCDTVAIVKSGAIVAAGGVEELQRAHRRRAVRIAIDGVDPSWAAAVPGATVATDDRHAGAVLLTLADGVDGQQLLDRARALGPVTHFSFEQPTLAELFRTVVAEPDQPDEAPAAGGDPGGGRSRRGRWGRWRSKRGTP